MQLPHRISISSSLALLVSLASLVAGQSLKLVTDFHMGPTADSMYIYVPPKIQKPAPIVVMIHGCGGSAVGFSQNTKFLKLADRYRYILVAPNARAKNKCHDVSSLASIRRNGGGDSQTIANMVKHAAEKYGGDIKRAYVVGRSSGAMMTNILAGAYPDLFQAAAVYSGVPDGCFYVQDATASLDPTAWNATCAKGLLTKNGEQWGDIVRNSYPGYNGPRPRMQIWHGTTDRTLSYHNFPETLKQWSNVLGVSNLTVKLNTPQGDYTQILYGNGTWKTAPLVGYEALGVAHNLPIHEFITLGFFGFS